jgi:hypothetical protein
MVILIGSHGVSDYEAWVDLGKKSMRDSERRAQFGIVESHAYRTDDGNTAIVIHTFNTLEEAQKYKAMMDTPEGHARLEQNGGAPPFTFWIAEEIEM